MGILLCILIACIVEFRLIPAQSYNQVINQFQNLFDSIGKSDAKNSEIYRDILQQEVAKEQQAFHVIKEELYTARNRNSDKKRNFHERSNNRENGIASKREIGGINSKWEAATLEEEWKRLNPKHMHIRERWKELRKLNHEAHRRICDDVVYQTMGEEETIKDYTYINASDIRKERVANMSVEFQHGMGATIPIQLVICRYNETEFYLAQGEEDFVFKLVDDPEKGVIFKSGQHRVLYDPFKWGDKNKTRSAKIPSELG